MVLLVDQNGPQVRGKGVFAERFGLPHPLPEIADGFVFVIEVEL